ncbi:uncharacterized protein EHS24_000001 [Apiotrichum porosum]|uniref:Uncharacterized protein n=1 Tax=Apiotrichum porosum TaxID=105984 RepID=A0A427Y8U5_9TREE|nr:uncharacterized protein EHS24_000001 [Apiotrichum porosum]RSH87493.1 hypothetical protein EHS24_000001 [Apiotrichum porosum]
MPVTFAPAPEHQRRLSASSPPVQLVVLAPRLGAAGPRYRGARPVPEDPFEESGVARAEGTTTQSAGADAAVRGDEEDAERQPLLGDDGPRPDVQWALTLGITVAIAAITFLILFVWKLTEPAPESDNGGA